MLAELPYSQAMIGPERPIIASRQDKEQQTKQEKKKNKIEQERVNKKVLLNDELLKKNRYDSPSGNYWRSGKWVLSIWHHFKLPVRLTFVWNKESLNGILVIR